MYTTTIGKIFHLFMAILMLFAVNQFNFFVAPLHTKKLGGSFRFLTFLNILFQTAYYFFAFAIDMLTVVLNKKSSEKLHKTRDFFLASIAFPYAMIVVSTFWSVYSVDRELIYPSFLDDLVPYYVNNLSHTSVALILLELIITPHQYPSRKAGLSFTYFIGVSYFVWISYIRYVSGRWVYIFMDHLNPPLFAVFVACLLSLANLFYKVGERFHLRYKSVTKKIN